MNPLQGQLVLQDIDQLLAGAGVADSLAMERHSESLNSSECLQASSTGKARGASKVLECYSPFILFC